MSKGRIIEIDLLRSIAIAMMVIYHAAFDLWSFYNWNINLYGAPWETFRIITVSLFLLCSGMSSQFSSHPLRRVAIVLGSAGLISLATYIYSPNMFIYFGILHCIGLGMIVMIPLKKIKEWNILFGILVLLIPSIPAPLDTLDYYPPTPWLGLILIGSGLSYFLYKRNRYRLLKNIPSLFTIPGRYALPIYIIHQPILLILLYFLHSW